MEGTLEAKGCGEPVFFFSGVPESVVGPAVAATVNGQDQSVRPVEERDYDGRKLTVKVPVNRFDVVLGDVAWRFERKTRPDRSWTFILETPNGSVELASGTFEHDWVGLTWAGDLDRDGRPDFVLERNAHIELYLSSAALPGRLVRRVAASQVVPGMDE